MVERRLLIFRRCIDAAQIRGTLQRSLMKMFRLACCRPGRVLLVSALMSSTLITSAVGEAFVLHRHGVRRAHLHMLGYGDLLTTAASSSRFGHSQCPKLALQSASQGVQTLAIVTTGSVFVSTPSSTGIDETGLVSPQNCPLFAIAGPQDPPAVNSPASLCPAQFRRTSTAVILLRNHTLLL